MKVLLIVLFFVIALTGGMIGSWLTGSYIHRQPVDLPVDAPPDLADQRPATRLQPTPIGHADAVASAEQSVVSIFISDSIRSGDYESFYGEYDPRASGIGSGVVISEDGYIITSYHVIDNADQIFIGTPRGDRRTAQVIGTDPETDLALLQADLDDPRPIVFSDSNRLRNGDLVLAIGNPFGVGKTVTMGIVSALGRSDIGVTTYERFIQTDAAINPGNSGGALINTSGELVGINSLIVTNSGYFQGVAFAVPANQVKTIIDQLRRNGRVIRGWLGVSFHTTFLPGDNREYVEVVGLFKDGPAEQEGIVPGDLILQINSVNVTNASEAKEIIARIPPGSPVNLTIDRQEEVIQLTVTATERPSIAE